MESTIVVAVVAVVAIVPVIGVMLLGLAALGTLYMLAAGIVFRRFFGRVIVLARRREAVSVLKPLHGAEPHLRENLTSFLRQDHDGPIQLLCGFARADDPAAATVNSLAQGAFGDSVTLIVDGTRHGASGKLSNLVNMHHHAEHAIVILSDSDMSVRPDYLAHILNALDAPGVGAVTLLYRGRGDCGFWSRMAAAGLSYQFLPGAVFGVATGLAKPCMGSTIALDQSVLDRIGGFWRFTNVLADDYAIGEAVRALDLDVAVPPVLIVHACTERSLAELWRHELRWCATVRCVVPGAYAGSVIGMPVPLAMLGAILAPVHAWGAALALVALFVRLFVAGTIDRTAGEQTAPFWMIPVRDCLTLAVFVGSFFVSFVDWRGNRLTMQTNGRIVAEAESVT